jgi:hypothetical protein
MGDFIMGMGREFATEAMDISGKMSLNEGNILFSAGDAAGHFYVLLKGQVQLSLGKAGPVVYQARHPGEIIGWSCLIGRETYSASAECTQATDLLRFDRETEGWPKCWAIACSNFTRLLPEEYICLGRTKTME